ncbi:MAG: class I SAM-dependent methyltransferase [Phycisphaerae bacterium]
MSFYDHIADEYTRITDSPTRRGAAETFIQAFLQRFGPKSAIDVACGTGLYALSLAAAGVETVGADISRGMLDHAKRQADRENLSLDWIQAPMQSLAEESDRTFDAVLCMGNSIPHLLDETDLDRTLAAFAGLLNPRGVLVIQLLNYEKLLRQGDRIVGINAESKSEYIRFYDFLDGLVRFNILTIRWTGDGPVHELTGTLLHPWTAGDFQSRLATRGFTDVKLLSDLDFSPFAPAASDTLMVVARKP